MFPTLSKASRWVLWEVKCAVVVTGEQMSSNKPLSPHQPRPGGTQKHQEQRDFNFQTNFPPQAKPLHVHGILVFMKRGCCVLWTLISALSASRKTSWNNFYLGFRSFFSLETLYLYHDLKNKQKQKLWAERVMLMCPT